MYNRFYSRVIVLIGILACSSIQFAQTPITFHTTNLEGKDLAFVDLYLDDQNLHLTTDIFGAALLEIDFHGIDSISVQTNHSFYKSEIIRLKLSHNGDNNFNITLTKRIVSVDNVVVTGTASPTHRDSSLRVVRVIDRSVIEGRSSNNARDLLRNELNIKTSEDGILGSGVSINGLGGQNVKILIDGVPMIGRLDGNIDLSQIDLSNIERVEIIEGPMSVEYGTNALAGTINFITKNKSYYKVETSADVKYETTGQYTHRVNFNNNNKLGRLSIGASRVYFDGWSHDDRSIDWIDDFLADSGRVSSWKPKLQYRADIKLIILKESWTITPSFSYFDESIENKGYPRAPYGEFAFDETYKTYRYAPAITLNKYSGNHKLWNVIFSWSKFIRHKNRLSTDLTTLNSTILSNPEANDTTLVHQVLTRGSRNFIFHSPVSLTLGWDINRESLSGARIIDNFKEITDAATFMQLGYKKKSSSIQLGVRKAWNSSYPPPITPSLHILHAKGKNQWRFNIARGFRSPSIKELYFEFIDSNHNLIGNPNLDAETSHNVALGVSRTINEGSLQINSHLSYIENMIQLVETIGDLTYEYQNTGNVQSHGVKVNYSNYIESFSYDGGCSLLGLKYNHEALYSTELALDVRWDMNENRTQLHFSTKRNGSVSRYFLDEEGDIIRGETDPYTFIDCNILHVFKKGQIRMTLGVHNLLDVQNINTSDMSGGHNESSGAYMMSWGRSFILSTRWSFNK